VSSLSTAVSKARTRISGLGDTAPQEYPISEELLNHILKVSMVTAKFLFVHTVHRIIFYCNDI
jgi:hypothetical protein